jgi:hypothetical protein
MVDEVVKQETPEGEVTPTEPVVPVKPTEPKETMLDAVSKAVDAETLGMEDVDGKTPTGDDKDGKPKAPDDKTQKTPDGEKPAEVKPDEPTGGESDAEKEAAKAAAEVAAAAEGKTPEEIAAAAAEGKTPEEIAAAAAAEKVPDHVNDPIPEELKEGTKERIRSLATMVKARDEDLVERTNERDEMIEMVRETGTSAEAYGQMLTFMSLYNSDDPEAQREAFKVIQAEYVALATKLGEPIPGHDWLAEHPDLAKEVEAGTLTEQRAQEVAQGRARTKANDAATVAASERADQDNVTLLAVAEGKAAMTALGTRLATDPQYMAKKAILVPALQDIMRATHPSDWVTVFETAYNKLVLPATVTPEVPDPSKPKEPTHEPLRPKNPAGEGKKEPTTMLEAVSQSLGDDIED